MLVPMNNVGGPPTSFALKMRPYFVTLLIAQSLLMVGRFLIMDMWGAMLTLLVVLNGTFVLSPGGGVDATHCMYYGLMCFVNGIFDMILCVERCIHVKYYLFDKKAPVMFNVASFVFVLCPIIEIAATILSSYIYVDAQEAESRLYLPQHGQYYSDISHVDGSRAGGTRAGQRYDQGYTAFEGRSEKL